MVIYVTDIMFLNLEKIKTGCIRIFHYSENLDSLRRDLRDAMIWTSGRYVVDATISQRSREKALEVLPEPPKIKINPDDIIFKPDDVILVVKPDGYILIDTWGCTYQ